MPSILIKGMKMPIGQPVRIVLNPNGQLFVDHGTWFTEYEAIELHDHGDLIDRNMLIGGFADWYIQESPMYLGDNNTIAETIGDAMKAIEDAPVVIPAERSEE